MSAPRPRLRRLRSMLLATLLLVGLLGFGVFPQEPLRRWSENRLRAALGPQAHIGRLHVVPLLLRAEAQDVRLSTATLDAVLPRVHVQLAPGALFEPGVHVARLELERPELTLRPATTTAPDGDAWSGPLEIASLSVSGGRLAYEGGPQGRLELAGLRATGALGHGVVQLSAERGRMEHATLAQPLGLDALRLGLRVTPELELHVTHLDLRSGGSRLEASGALGRAGRHLALDVTGQVELADIARLAGIEPLAGPVVLQGRVEGSASAPRVTATLTAQEIDAAGWPIERAQVLVTHQATGPGETRVRLEATVFGGLARGEATVIGDAADARVSLSAVPVPALAHRFAPAARVTAGHLSAELHAHGALRGPLRLDGKADAHGRIDAHDVTVQAGVHGVLDPVARRSALEWTLESQAVGDASATLHELQVHAAGHASGALPPVISGRIEGRARLAGATRAAGEPPPPIDVTFAGPLRADGPRAETQLDAQMLDGRVHAALSLRGARIEALHVTGDALRLEPLVAGLGGHASLELRASGPASALDGTGRVEIDQAVWSGVALGALSADLRLERGRAHITARAPRLRAESVATLADGSLRGRIELKGTPLEPLGAWLSQPLTGSLEALADVELPLEAPAQARVEARVSALSLDRAGWGVRATRAFDVRHEHGRTSIRDLSLEGAGVRLDVEGELVGSGGPFDARARVEADLGRLPLAQDLRASGRVLAELHAGGTWAQPRAEGWIDLRDVNASVPGASGATLPPIALDDARLELQGDALVLPALRLHADSAALDVSGRIPWAAVLAQARRAPSAVGDDEQAQLTLEWRGVDLRRWLAALSPRHAGTVEATLAGKAVLQGGLLALGELSGRVELPETNLRAAEVPFALAPLTLRIDGGRVHTDALRLSGRDSVLTLNGALDLTRGELDVRGQGGIDLRLLSPFLADAAVTGQVELDAEVSGSLARPHMLGTLVLERGSLRLRELRQPLTETAAWLTLDDDRLELRELSARLGGGTLRATGSARLADTGLADIDLRLHGDDIGLQYPAGLRSRLDAELRLAGRAGALRLGGTISVERGLYDLDVVAEQSLFGTAARPEPSPLLRSVALDLAVELTNPVLVRNNLVDLRAGGQLRLRGDLETPTPIGRLDIVPGGTARLSGRDFIIERGSLSYAGDWNAGVDLRAASAQRVEDRSALSFADAERSRRAPDSFDVAVVASGTLDEPRLALQSTPPLDERSLTSLLLTGRQDADVTRLGGLAAGEQTAALLTGRLARGLTEGLRPLGIDQVTIEPQLVARETDPGARFTFGRQLTPRASLVYSTSLKSPEDRFVRLNLGPLYSVRLGAQRQTDGQRALDLGQRLEWGGARRARTAPPRPDERVTLTDVSFDGDAPLPENELLRALDLAPGERRTRWELIDRAESLRAHLVHHGFLEAEVGTRLEEGRARVHISSGPRYAWRVEGLRGAPDLRRVVHSALFEEEALERGRARLLRTLHARGHLRARVDTHVQAEANTRTLVFSVEPGPLLSLEGVRFPGARALSRKELLRLAGGAAGILADPQAAAEAWAAAYRERHYLSARVEPPRVAEAAGRLTIEARIDEGPPARLTRVRFEGATLDPAQLEHAAGLRPGARYDDAGARGAAQRVRDHYLGLGYPEVRVTPEGVASAADVELVLHVTEGPPVRIAQVSVAGAHMTHPGLLLGRAGLVAGAPLDLRELGAAEGRLRALGTLSSARVALDPDAPGRLRLEVEELRRFALGYNYRYDDKEGTSVQVDGELRHLFGRGLVLGGRYQRGRDNREARAFVNLPLRPGPLTVSASRVSEELPGIGDTINNRVQRELRVQQVLERRPWLLLGGYRFKRLTLAPFQVDPVDVAALSLSVLRETRDNPMDARSGRFYGIDLELAPGWLGADLRFVKGFAQALFARSRGPFTWAHGYRLGLGASLSAVPIRGEERFRAGGPNSVRGFATDSLGPLGVDDRPAGGEAVLVLNQELRWRHASGVGAALFYDAGNVFTRVSDVSFDLRHTLGTGLRYASPFGLVRVDLGVPLARRDGERRYRIYFSIGQAF